MKSLYRTMTIALAAVLMSVAVVEYQGRLLAAPPDGIDISRITGDAKPFFEVWDEEFIGPCGLNVAMDGSVLMFKDIRVKGKPELGTVGFKRSEDGGATWSDVEVLGKHIKLDCEALGITP